MTDTSDMDEPMCRVGVGDRHTADSGRLRAWIARRARDDRGATLIEAAFVTPVFVLLVFGLIEFSGFVAARTASNAGLQAGARMATVAGADDQADLMILNAIAREGAGLGANDEILWVKVWKSDPPKADENIDPESDIPTESECFVQGEDFPEPENFRDCNMYKLPGDGGADSAFARALLPLSDADQEPTPANSDYWFGCAERPSLDDDPAKYLKYDCGWPPESRKNTVAKSQCEVDCGGTDLVGIAIKTRHNFYTGFFGKQVEYIDRSINAIEPQRYR